MEVDKRHVKCLLWKALWGLGALSFIFALVADTQTGSLFGLDSGFWFWCALILAVLSIPIKIDCHSCTVCQIGPR